MLNNEISNKRLFKAFHNIDYNNKKNTKTGFKAFYSMANYIFTSELKYFKEKTASFSLNTLNNFFGAFKYKSRHKLNKKQRYYFYDKASRQVSYETIAMLCFKARNFILLKKLLSNQYASKNEIKRMLAIAKQQGLKKFEQLFLLFVDVGTACKKISKLLGIALNNKILNNEKGFYKLPDKLPEKTVMQEMKEIQENKKPKPVLNKKSFESYNKDLQNLTKKQDFVKDIGKLSLEDKKKFWLAKLRRQ